MTRSQKAKPFNYYVAGFFDGEGCVSKAGSLIIVNTDLYLLKKISLYLSRIGIKNTLSKRKRRKTHHKDSYALRIFHRENLKKFYEHIPFMQVRKLKRLVEYIKKTKKAVTTQILNEIKDDRESMSLRAIARKRHMALSTFNNYLIGRTKPNEIK